MKMIEMKSAVDNKGYLIFSEETVSAAGLKPGDEVYVTLTVSEEENYPYPMILIMTEPLDITIHNAQEMDEEEEPEVEDDLTLPYSLLEDANIPLDSDLDIICGDREIKIRPADPLDRLPDELHGLFDNLGIHSDTVREVMKKEGYFV